MIFADTNWNFSALDNFSSVWGLMTQIGLLLIALLAGNILRNVIPFFRKNLFPSALIGGSILLILKSILQIWDVYIIDESVMQVVTYHALAIGFIAMTLKVSEKKMKSKEKTTKFIENGFMTGATYMLQAVLGLSITILMFYLPRLNNKPTIFYSTGMLLPLSFGQGPGNALAWDINFSNAHPDMLNTNGSFGLSLASIGFIVASVFGVFYINYFKGKGQIKERFSDIGFARDSAVFESHNEIPDNESIDKLSIQVALVFLTYAIAYLFMYLMAKIGDFTNSLAWGFNFLWGVFAAYLVKFIIVSLKKKNVLKKKYINNYQMDRISGFSFDLMIVAGVTAIKITDIKDYILLLIVLSIVGTFATYLYLRKVTKKLFKGYEHEMFVTNFGTLTGTASNGVILLKEIDPNYETPANELFVLSQAPATICVAPILLLLNFVNGDISHAFIALGIFAALFIGYNIFLFRNKIFKRKGKETSEIETTGVDKNE